MFDRIRFGFGAYADGPVRRRRRHLVTGLKHVGVLVAYDRQQIKVNCIGTIGFPSGAEIFSFGWHVTGAESYNAVVALAGLDVVALTAIIADYFDDNALLLCQDAALTSVKYSALGVDGLLVPDSEPREQEVAGGGVTGASTGRVPNQIALAVSLRTVANLGLATKGRFYLPLPVSTPDREGFLSTTYTAGVATRTAAMLDAFNTELQSPDPTSVVANMSNNAATGVIKTRTVTRVLVGNVVDTIRSRRNALPETYNSAAVAF